jgi:hypothetical protein
MSYHAANFSIEPAAIFLEFFMNKNRIIHSAPSAGRTPDDVRRIWNGM